MCSKAAGYYQGSSEMGYNPPSSANEEVTLVVICNLAEGTQVRVVESMDAQGGPYYKVTLKDLDSGSTLPQIKRFNDKGTAITYAHACVKAA